MDQTTIEKGKTLAFVAYLTLMGTLIAYFMNKEKENPFTHFHIRQGLGLGLAYILIAIVIGGLDNMMVSMSFWIFFSVLYIYGIVGAITGKLNKVPLLGNYFQNAFKSIGQ